MTDDPYRNDPVSALRGRNGGLSGASGVKDRVTDGANQAKSRVLDGFSRLVDSAEGQIHRAPSDLQPGLKGAVKVARDRPFATMAGLAAIALLLARGQRRR